MSIILRALQDFYMYVDAREDSENLRETFVPKGGLVLMLGEVPGERGLAFFLSRGIIHLDIESLVRRSVVFEIIA